MTNSKFSKLFGQKKRSLKEDLNQFHMDIGIDSKAQKKLCLRWLNH